MIQSTNGDGQGNVIVQIEGDRNTVNLRGLAHLTLTRFLNLRDSKTDTDLLSPYSRSIELVGRDQEMANLHGWLDSDNRISVRVLVGQAGAGKTRLALELCERLEEPWDAGSVRDRELHRFLAAQNLSSWGWQRPTLVVVDYAASHAEALHGWLGELADYSGPAKERLRPLLLERRTIGLIAAEHGPDDARKLVGHRSDHDVEGPSGDQAIDPPPETSATASREPDQRACAVHQLSAQIPITPAC